MQKTITSVILILFIFVLPQRFFSQNVLIGSSTSSTVDASSLLEMRSSNLGFSLPNVNLVATTVADPVISPLTGLVVFNTALTGGVNGVTPGFYYWDGTRWLQLLTGAVPTFTAKNGLNIWNGIFPPPPATGLEGDYYIQSVGNTPMFFGPKTAITPANPNPWPQLGNQLTAVGLTGPTGVGTPGSVYTGPTPPAIGQGTVGDMYVQMIGSAPYALITVFGPKTAIGWGSGTDITTANNFNSKNAWFLNGNTGTNPSTNYLGTQGAQEFIIKTMNAQRMHLSTNGNVAIGTTPAHPSAVLDLQSSNRGMLFPNVLLTATDVAAPVVSPITGLIVFNINTATSNNITPGFYFWNSSSWIPLTTSLNIVGPQGPEGDRGNFIFSGAGTPTLPQVIDGDFYLNTTTNELYGPFFTAGNVWQNTLSLNPPFAANNGTNGAHASVIIPGTVAPSVTANPNDFYYDRTAKILYGPKLTSSVSADWSGVETRSLLGTNAAHASLILFNNFDPVPNITGKEGDYYLNTISKDFFGPRLNGAWPKLTNLMGPVGDPGTSVTRIVKNTLAPAISNTMVIGDYWGQTDSFTAAYTNTLYGPATNTLWGLSSNTAGISLKGVTGIQGDEGLKLLFGAIPPANNTGTVGEFYIDSIAQILYGPKGPNSWTDVAITKTASLKAPVGNNGSAILTGSVDPNTPNLLGQTGDIYFKTKVVNGNMVSTQLYDNRLDGGWDNTKIYNLIGSKGAIPATIYQGTASAYDQPTLGVVGDYYLQAIGSGTDAILNLFGPKASPTAWSNNFTTLTGLDGDQGTNGKDGTRLFSGTLAPSQAGAITYSATEGDFYIHITPSLSILYGPKTVTSALNPSGFNPATTNSAIISGSIGVSGKPSKALNFGILDINEPSIIATGTLGEFYYNKANFTLYGPKNGPNWSSAPSKLLKVKDANIVLTGLLVPNLYTNASNQNTLGLDGDFYIHRFTSTDGLLRICTLYGPKTNSLWPTTNTVNLIGQSNAILIGTIAPQSHTLANGTNTLGNVGDFYVNTTSSLFYGPKSSNLLDPWQSNVSIIGPKGLKGPKGPLLDKNAPGTIKTGVVNPHDNIGAIGDYYINNNTKMLYGPKSAPNATNTNPSGNWSAPTQTYYIGSFDSLALKNTLSIPSVNIVKNDPNGYVPLMYTTYKEGFEVIASSFINSREPNMALVQTYTTASGASIYWQSKPSSGPWITIKTDKPISIYKADFQTIAASGFNGARFEASLNNSTWDSIAYIPNVAAHPAITTVAITNTNTYQYFRLRTIVPGPNVTTSLSGFQIYQRVTETNNLWELDPANKMIKLAVNSAKEVRSLGSEFVLNDGGNVAIGTNTPHPSAILEIASINKGFAIPRMTNTQMNTIASPIEGMQVFNTTLKNLCFYNGTAWIPLKPIKKPGAIPTAMHPDFEPTGNFIIQNALWVGYDEIKKVWKYTKQTDSNRGINDPGAPSSWTGTNTGIFDGNLTNVPGGTHCNYRYVPGTMAHRYSNDDIMIKVGSSWSDKYANKVIDTKGTEDPIDDEWLDDVVNATFSLSMHGNGQGIDPNWMAFSQRSRASTGMTWYVAKIVAANAGKMLIGSGDWQVTAAGTANSGTVAAGIFNIPNGSTWDIVNDMDVSRYGAVGMVGNLWESIDFEAQFGKDGTAAQNETKDLGDDWGNDYTYNVSSLGLNVNTMAFEKGRLTSPKKGGSYVQEGGSQVGIFAFDGNWSINNYNNQTSFRCSRR